MIITESTVKKLMINGIQDLDAIAVMVENFGPGAGKITITCFNECWSNYWGAMGKHHTIESFFMKCSNDYLVGKLKSELRDEINDDDEDAMTKALRAEIIKDRRNGWFGKDEARELWDESESPSDGYGAEDRELFYKVFGDDWWDCRPKKPNPEYLYLRRIIETVQKAFAQLQAEKHGN